jgi:hypothetical protein
MSFHLPCLDNTDYPTKRISLQITTAKGCCVEIPVADCSKLLPPYLGGVGLGCVISLVADLAQPYRIGFSE